MKSYLLPVLALLGAGTVAAAPCPPDPEPPIYVGRALYNNFDRLHCLSAEGIWDGAKIIFDDCASLDRQRWDIGPDVGAVRLHGTNYCLDGGAYPGDLKNGAKLYLKNCAQGRLQWWWYPHGDYPNRVPRVESAGKMPERAHSAPQRTNFCIDLPDGRREVGNHVQMWTCFDGNLNQHWDVGPWRG